MNKKNDKKYCQQELFSNTNFTDIMDLGGKNNKISQGTTANTKGHGYENLSESIYTQRGFVSMSEKQYDKLPIYERHQLGNYKILKNSSYINDIGESKRGEFVISLDNDTRRIRKECKTQDVRGTADEKLDCCLADAIASPEKEVFISLKGNGFSPQKVDYLVKKTEWGNKRGYHLDRWENKVYKKVYVFTSHEQEEQMVFGK